MAKEWDIDLKDGSIIQFTGTMEEAAQEQARLNAEIDARPVPAPRTPDTFGQNVLDFLGEASAAANRAVMQGLDFIGPGSFNAAARLMGSDYQIPTFAQTFQENVPGAQGGFMDPGSYRDMTQGFGAALPAAIGMTPVTRNLASPLQAGAEFLGLGAARPQASVPAMQFGGYLPYLTETAPGGPVQSLPGAVEGVLDQPWMPRALNPAQRGREMAETIAENPESVRRAGFAMDPYTGKAGAEAAGRASMKQGYEDDFVAMVEASNDSTKGRLSQMLEKVRARKETRRAANQRPLDVAGESYLNRIQIVQDANQRAADQIDTVAQTLKGNRVDVSTPVQNFAKSLANMGIGLRFDPGSNRVVGSFDGSDIEGLDGLVKLVNRVLKRMSSGARSPELGVDAYDVHRLKRYIDENVSYDRKQGGLGGRLDTYLKRLRSQLDGTLDVNFPDYNRVNSQYSETAGALKDLQTMLGSKVDVNARGGDSALGQQMRTLLTNYKSRQMLETSIEDMQTLARKYSARNEGLIPYEGVIGGRPLPAPADLEDDLYTLVLFNDELEKLFGSAARGSMQGIMDKAADRTAQGVITGQSGFLPLIEAGVKWTGDKIRNIGEDQALEAMERLLQRR